MEYSSLLWRRRLGHASIDLIKKLLYNKHVHGLPKLKFGKDHLCNASQMGKQVKNSMTPKNVISHIGLFKCCIGPFSSYKNC